MSAEVLTLINGSDVPQSVYDPNGRRHTLEPHQVLPLPGKVAKQFLDERGKFVTIWKPVSVPFARPGESVVYIANVTGSPFLSEKVAHKYLDKATKLEKVEMIPNPLRVPFPITRMYPQPQRIGDSPGGTKTTFSTPPLPVRIPPWHRLPVPQSCADWLLRRDAQQDEKVVGGLVLAREPSSFEPNETWELPEILVYSRMVDDSAQGWVPEREVWKAIMENDDTRTAELKIQLLNTLFYRLVDERWTLPTKQAFDGQLQRVLEEHTRGTKGKANAASSTSAASR